MTRRHRDPSTGLTYATFSKHIRAPNIPWRSFAPNVIAMNDLIVAAGPREDDVLIGRVLGRALDRWQTSGAGTSSQVTRLEVYPDDRVVLAVLAVCGRRNEDPLGLTSMQLYHVDVRDVSRVLEPDNPALLWLLTGKMPKIGEALRALKYGALGNSYITKYLSDQGQPAPAELRFDEVRNRERKALLAEDRKYAKAKGTKP